ncbi:MULTISPECIES: multidrug effflux MFS transporter [unclassified Streptomyces]|uniref:multidrug effflux MFS transporter n=1 Tax=Streptomyces TaxID=1883 RepID=UPI00136E399E|nr:MULTISPECIES: multidrug effflux MFS transporter [unclassified Streptomyces]NEA05069.1 multidrug effflux MFS transporter [Streptomyces sp. SID10116]MYY80905.1 Bcr/CflA family efflux MFS transporter [Streptomyces sp. SID335]MYZ16904.1 Bcr/CflA family efflux MFS transporter [Streptomyces sp. SID337]NDZ89451.1 multidrug effflux MFS transporter [Streptomyces sp. SID10115]NEB49085.1 multidrug effflux MFS transporter [Streptomyces sp. SID339]
MVSRRPLIFLVLAALTALPSLSSDVYLPALPEVAHTFTTTAVVVQLTLTSCLIGMALGQLAVGPLSDRLGRRRPLLAGMILYTAASIACALAPTAGALVGLRFVQGVAGAAGIVIARAIIRDLYEGVKIAQVFSTLMLISGVAPVIAPLFGAQLLHVTDWRGIFAALAVLGLVVVAAIVFGLPETLPTASRRPRGMGFAQMKGLLADRVFAGCLITAGGAFGAFFAYLAASPFVLQDVYGASPQTYALLFGINAAGMVATGQLNGRILVRRFSVRTIVTAGLGLLLLAGLAMLVLATGLLGHSGLPAVCAVLFVLVSSLGLLIGNANALAMNRTARAAGAASALLGSSSFLVGALVSPMAGLTDSAVPMALIQTFAATAALICFTVLTRGRLHTPEPK